MTGFLEVLYNQTSVEPRWSDLVWSGLVHFVKLQEVKTEDDHYIFFFIYYINIRNAVKSMQILILVILE